MHNDDRWLCCSLIRCWSYLIFCLSCIWCMAWLLSFDWWHHFSRDLLRWHWQLFSSISFHSHLIYTCIWQGPLPNTAANFTSVKIVKVIFNICIYKKWPSISLFCIPANYFSTVASYSEKYARGSRAMFLTRVLCGLYTVGNSDDTHPPYANGRMYDSCVDNLENPLMYMVYANDQCYPEYVIHFR